MTRVVLALVLVGCTPVPTPAPSTPDASAPVASVSVAPTVAPSAAPSASAGVPDDAELAKKKASCATAYAQQLHLGCPSAEGPAWTSGACSKLTAAQVSCVTSAKSCLAVLKCEGL